VRHREERIQVRRGKGVPGEDPTILLVLCTRNQDAELVEQLLCLGPAILLDLLVSDLGLRVWMGAGVQIKLWKKARRATRAGDFTSPKTRRTRADGPAANFAATSQVAGDALLPGMHMPCAGKRR
jgi:hypothetical protein